VDEQNRHCLCSDCIHKFFFYNNNNKTLGKGLEIPERQLKPPCDETKCKQKCYLFKKHHFHYVYPNSIKYIYLLRSVVGCGNSGTSYKVHLLSKEKIKSNILDKFGLESLVTQYHKT
jgi:hypothetical protein